jgi:hypothetical protein
VVLGWDESTSHLSERKAVAKRLADGGVSRRLANHKSHLFQFFCSQNFQFKIFEISTFLQAQGSYRPDRGRATSGVFLRRRKRKDHEQFKKTFSPRFQVVLRSGESFGLPATPRPKWIAFSLLHTALAVR